MHEWKYTFSQLNSWEQKKDPTISYKVFVNLSTTSWFDKFFQALQKNMVSLN